MTPKFLRDNVISPTTAILGECWGCAQFKRNSSSDGTSRVRKETEVRHSVSTYLLQSDPLKCKQA